MIVAMLARLLKDNGIPLPDPELIHRMNQRQLLTMIVAMLARLLKDNGIPLPDPDNFKDD